ncbi:MAG: hypothetical protein WAN35_08740 [Terracidiphilus sp.]
MNTNLRPMNLGEILDRTFQIYRKKFLNFIGIAAIPSFMMIFIETINRVWWGLVPFRFDGDIYLFSIQWTTYLAALYQFALFLHLLFWPASVCLTSRLYCGERSNFTAWAFRGNASWRSWLWTATANWGVILFVLELIFFGLFLSFYFFWTEVIKINESTEEWLMPDVIVILFLMGLVTFCWISSAFFSAIPVKTVEGLKIGKALRRSWTLSKGGRWKIFSIRFIFWLFACLMNFSLVALFVWVFRWTVISFHLWLHFYRNIQIGIVSLIAFFVSILFSPIFPIALTLIYYDQRIRLEGYDIERMMESAGMIAPEPGAAAEPISTAQEVNATQEGE